MFREDLFFLSLYIKSTLRVDIFLFFFFKLHNFESNEKFGKIGTGSSYPIHFRRFAAFTKQPW